MAMLKLFLSHTFSVCVWGMSFTLKARGQQSAAAHLRNKADSLRVGFPPVRSKERKKIFVFRKITRQSRSSEGGGANDLGTQRRSFPRDTGRMCEWGWWREDVSAAIFTLPSVCVAQMLRVQFRASYLLLGVQPAHYWEATSAHSASYLLYMRLTRQIDAPVTINI